MFRPDNTIPQASVDELHIVFHQGQLLSDMRLAEGCLIPAEQVRHSGWNEVRRQFLGYWRDRPCYVVEIHEVDEPDPLQYQKGNLYHILGRVDEQLFALAGRAQQLLAWERDHQFCGRCGQPMRIDHQERAMRCDPCRVINYPRIAPCVIVLITRGEEMLLARNANFPQPMYSTLAGFIEAGESAEETLIREVREEVGVEVNNLRYFQSQSWPFPNQLMLGFFADYAGGDIVCDQVEIADAQWFHYSDLPLIPPVASISGQLIQAHIDSMQR
ncbi:MAG: NAD(+) diphosphatase [Gammaproteobacteria bacterium]|jgi:NAD+ diphosphatase|nr:NAD(+) diphosphatase [Gammaproteobacteria bacterium]